MARGTRPITLGPLKFSPDPNAPTTDSGDTANGGEQEWGPEASDPNVNPNITQEDDMDAQTLPETSIDTASENATNLLNAIEVRREALMKEIRKYGEQALLGENSLINLAETLVDGAVENVFTSDSGRKVKSDSVMAYEAFRNPNAGKKNAQQRIETQSATSFQSNAKKLDNFIKLGQHYRAKGKKFFNDARDVYSGMMKDEQERKSIKLKAEYEAVLHLVRQQLKRGDATTAPIMSADEMRVALRKEESEAKTAIDLLAEAYISMKKAYEGGKADLTRGIEEREALKDEALKTVMDDLYKFVRDLDASNPGMDIRKTFDEAVLPKKRAKKDNGSAADNTAGQLPSTPGIPGGVAVRQEGDETLDEGFDETSENIGGEQAGEM